MGRESPSGGLRGQIYLGYEAFVANLQPDRRIHEVPRLQTHAHLPSLWTLFSGKSPSPPAPSAATTRRLVANTFVTP